MALDFHVGKRGVIQIDACDARRRHGLIISRSGKLAFCRHQKVIKFPFGKLADSHSGQPPPTERASAWQAAPYFRHAYPAFLAILLFAPWWKAQPFGHCYGDHQHDHHRHSSEYRRAGLFLLAAVHARRLLFVPEPSGRCHSLPPCRPECSSMIAVPVRPALSPPGRSPVSSR